MIGSWFTADQLAGLSLPGIPKTKRGVNQVASEQAWSDAKTMDGRPLARRKAGRGRGYEYHVDVLPAPARAALLARAARPRKIQSEELDNDNRDSGARWQAFEKLSDKAKGHARSRLAALHAVELLEAGGSSRTAAISVVAAQHQCSTSSLWNWFDLVAGCDRRDWLAYLAPAYKGGGHAKAEIDDEAWQYFLADYLRGSKPSPAECWQRLQDAARDHGWTLPKSLKTLTRKLQREVDPAVITLKRDGADALASRIPAQRRRRDNLRALEAVNYDGHKLDLFVRWPDGTKDRAILLTFQDLASNKILAWRLDTSESAEGFRLAFGDLVERWGIPDMVFSDNTMAAAAKSNTGGSRFRNRYKIKDDDFVGLFPALGIDLRFTKPAHGQSKPIERAFGDLSRYISKAPECEGAYTGNAPQNKPWNYGARAIDLADLLPVCEREINRFNSRTDRNSSVAKDRSCDDVFAESYARDLIRKPVPGDETLRRLWLLSVEGLTCRAPSGEIHLHGNRYWTEALGRIVGQKVAVRFDPDRLHQPIHVYDLDGRYLCAAECIEDSGFVDRDAAKRHAKALADHRRATRELAEAELRLSASDVARLTPAVIDQPAPDARVVRAHRFRGNAAVKAAPDLLEDQDRGAFSDQFVANVLQWKAEKDRHGL